MGVLDYLATALNADTPQPMTGFRFKVYMQSAAMGFTQISSIEDSVDTEAIQEGGVNDRVYSLLKPVTSERTLVMSRGKAYRGLLGLFSRLKPGTRIGTDVIIAVMKQNGGVGTIFLVQGAFIKKISYSELNATSSTPLIETIEMSYEKMTEYSI